MFEYIVWFAAVLSNVANFPAMYKIIKTKKAKDFSIITSYIWVFITLILSIHAIRIGDIYFIISNVGMFIVNLAMTILIIKYG